VHEGGRERGSWGGFGGAFRLAAPPDLRVVGCLSAPRVRIRAVPFAARRAAVQGHVPFYERLLPTQSVPARRPTGPDAAPARTSGLRWQVDVGKGRSGDTT
jgi:hypothetical protein